jgi:colanic acid biosynthesis glycosyl transferase WcaI
MAAWLSMRGHQVRVVTAPPYYPAWRISDVYRDRGYFREGGGPAGDGSGEPLVIRCPIYVPAAPTAIKRLLHLLSFAISALPVMVREVFAAPDVIFTVEPALFCAPIALACGILAEAPVWLHVQDFEVDAAFDLGLLPRRGLLHWVANRLDRLITRSFQRVSTISVRMLQRLLTKEVPLDRAVLFPNWVDVNLVKPGLAGESNRYRQQLNLCDKVVLLYSGNMGGKQGLEMLPPLAAALSDDPRVHFVFCGDGAFRPQLEDMVAGMTNVTLLPLQPMEDLNDLLNAANIHLLPQRAGAADLVMPSKLTGILSSGRPAIATAPPETEVATVVGGIMGSHEACGLVVPPGDIDAFIRAVRILVDNEQMRLDMGKRARLYAERYLATQQVLEQFEIDLREAVKEHRGSTHKPPYTPFCFPEFERRQRQRPSAAPRILPNNASGL